MAIVRVIKDKSYSVISNVGLKDERLSWKARGILAYLLTLPDDWEVYLEEVEKHSEMDGRESFRNGIKELKKFGYFETVKVHDKQGHFQAENRVYEIPRVTGFPKVGKTGRRENRETENPTLLSTDQLSTNKQNTDKRYDDGQQDSLTFYLENFGMASPFVMTSITEWENDTSSDVVIAAMKIALKRNKRSFGYVEGILKDWANHKVTSMNEARAYEKERKNQTVRPFRNNRKQGMVTDAGYEERVKDLEQYNLPF